MDENNDADKKATDEVLDKFASMLETTRDELAKYVRLVDAEGSNVISLTRKKPRSPLSNLTKPKQ